MCQIYIYIYICGGGKNPAPAARCFSQFFAEIDVCNPQEKLRHVLCGFPAAPWKRLAPGQGSDNATPRLEQMVKAMERARSIASFAIRAHAKL